MKRYKIFDGKWRYFETFKAASDYASKVFDAYGIVVGIEEA